MGVLELLFDYIEDHTHAAELIEHRRPLALGILGFLLGALSLFIAQAASGKLWPLSFTWPSLALLSLWQVIAGFILASVLHLVLEMSGAQGRASLLFIHLGLADTAWAVAVPAALISQALFPNSRLLLTGVFLVVGIFNAFLKARAIQDSYRVTLGRAWVTLAVPYLALGAAVALAMALTAVIAFIGVVKAFS